MLAFSIRSFGSWGEAVDQTARIKREVELSVSALSDRGVRRSVLDVLAQILLPFSIRPFGSWGEAPQQLGVPQRHLSHFQYPLFRIVG